MGEKQIPAIPSMKVNSKAAHRSSEGILFVDMDGTLVKNDALLESLVTYLKQNIFRIFVAFFWLLRGKNYFKTALSQTQPLDVKTLVYNSEFLAYLSEQKESGRKLVLITGSPQNYAQKVAQDCPIFSEVHGSSEVIDLTGTRKLNYILNLIGKDQPFTYAGNASIDLHVWKGATEIIVVNGSPSLHRRAQALSTSKKSTIFDEKRSPWKIFIKAMRMYQWVKNLLIFVPAITAHQLNDPATVWISALCFISYSLCASGVYLINDLWDLNHDRQNPSKKKRPFASGELSLLYGIIGAPCLLIPGLLIAAVASASVFYMTLTYILLSLMYSIKWKEFVVIDVLTLSLLYNWRILSGAVAGHIELSPWLIGFMGFLFYSLALAKRAAELNVLKSLKQSKSGGRGYQVSDLLPVSIIGCGSGLVAVLILALYINSYRVLTFYPNSFFLWPLCIVCLYWISRIWLITIRGEMNQDPVAFALKDKPSYVAGILTGILYFLSAYELW